MAYHLQGRSYVSLNINGSEFPFNEINQLDFLHVLEAAGSRLLPQLTLRIKDGQRWFLTGGHLADKSLIKVTVGPGSLDPDQQRTMEFRLASHSEESLPGGVFQYTLNGLLDAPRFVASTLTDPIDGTSSQVLQRLAEYSGLTFKGVGTADQQVWWPSNRRVHTWAAHVAERGYATDSSCMALAVNALKVMTYRDITAMDAPAGTFSLMDLTGIEGIPVTSFAPGSKSGVFNDLMGYASTALEQAIGKENITRIHQGIGALINEGGKLMQNGLVKANIGSGAARVSPVDPGNNHEFSERARYQNDRGKSLFNTSLMFTTPVVSKVELLDTCVIAVGLVRAADPSVEAFAGNSRVLRKVTYVTSSGYAEKFTVVRRTLNTKELPNAQEIASPGSSGASGASGSATHAKTVEVPAPLKSVADYLGFDPSTIQAKYDSAMAVLNSQAVQTGLAVAGVVAAAVATMKATPNVDPPLDALIDQIKSLEAAGVAAVLAQKATVPYGDPENTLPPVVALHQQNITDAIAAALPLIETRAQRTLAIAASTKTVAEGQRGAADSTAKFQDSAAAVGAALGSLGSPPGFSSSVSQATTTYQASSTSASSTAQTAATSAVTEATALETRATTYPAIIEAQRAPSFAAIAAAATYP